MSDLLDVLVVGAGPTGLAVAIEAHVRGMSCVVLDKGCVVNSVFHFPTQMIFFTTPELLEIGGHPFVCDREKPNRHEALKYYRRVVSTMGLRVRQFEAVETIERYGAHRFRTRTTTQSYDSKNVVIATGYYDNANRLGVPGEDLPHVSHYYTEAHPFYDRDVVVIGGKNSAVDAALDLYRNGARVTLIHRGAALGQTVKYWVRPDIDNRIQRNEVAAFFNARVVAIGPRSVTIDHAGQAAEVPAEQVFAMTGYYPSTTLLDQLGVRYDGASLKPEFDPETFETNVPGAYLAGSIIAGRKNGEIFIENGRLHGKAVVRAIAAAIAEEASKTG